MNGAEIKLSDDQRQTDSGGDSGKRRGRQLSGRSLTGDLSITLTLVLAVVLSVLLISDNALNAARQRREIDSRAKRYASQLVQILATPLWTHDTIGLAHICNSLIQDPQVNRIRITDPRGRLLYDSMDVVLEAEDKITKRQTLTYKSNLLGEAEIEFSLLPMQKESRGALQNTAITLVLALAALTIAVTWTTGILLRRPLDTLERGMAKVARGDFKAGIKGYRYRELEGMASSFVTMTEEIKARQDALEDQIAERKAAEERYALAVKGANDGIWDWDLTTDHIYFSPRWKEILGFGPSEFPDDIEEWKKRIHPEDSEWVVNAHQNYMAGFRDTLDLEYRLRHRDGSWRVVHTQGASLKNDAGDPVRIAGALSDITERKQAEAALKESEERYRSLIETTSEGYVLLDNELMVRDTNEALCQLLGISREALLDKPFLDLLDEEARAIVLAHATSEEKTPHRIYEFAFKQASGSQVDVLASATIMTGRKGQPSGSFVFFTDITDRKRMEDQLRYQATHDPLTELPNRTLCLDRIQRAMERARRREGYYYAVIFLDLDRFKVINDSMGHNFGDQLLIEVGNRLLECVRELDTVSRFGGDEFIILLEELGSPRRATEVVKRMRLALRRPISIDGQEVQLTASMGIALGPTEFKKPEDLLQYANIAMHRCKATGRDRFKFFSARMLEHAMQLMTLENHMERALTQGEFFLNFQPILRLNGDKTLYGFEALARWNHPERGLVPPSEFIPVAEDTGIILNLGLWILARAAQTLADWNQRLPGARDLTMAVNVSGRQFAQHDLAKRIKRILDQFGVPPQQIKLEITETAIMDNADLAVNILRNLKDLGVTLSIDDFGTGYSSMSYLQRLPLDNLKIDLSFVQMLDMAPENVEIVKAIINLAHTLKLEVVAEGVERPAHQEILEELGCDYCQGFLYAKPMSMRDAEAFILKMEAKDTAG